MRKLNRRESIIGMLLSVGAIALGREFMSIESPDNKKMPVLFLGHGNPMNAIQENKFTQSLNQLGENLPRPKAILMISAHWETNGVFVTGMERPKTIHDFGGFPKELFEVQYPAPGAPEIAKNVSNEIEKPNIKIDINKWGLDHGTWSVLKHIFPNADVPVFQLSLDRTKPMEFHFEMGKKLKFLREQGVMIMGSGNIVHNLKEVNWKPDAKAYDWAIEFDKWVKNKIDNKNYEPLFKEALNSQAGKLSIPTLEHYLPLLYTLGASDESDELTYDYEGIDMSSMSMRCLRFGA
ncbi:MAG: 4,5-DOPA dioxygenase extradiol [Bacteriovoracaceae bacterium]|nr:4,5-DOPA dioxygenase extradiol [Bacteriovoracaceae bacterium]